MNNFLKKLCFLKDKFEYLRLNLNHKRGLSQVILFVLFLSGIFSILVLNNFSQKVLAIAGAHWIQATASADWSERKGHASVVFNNKMWVIGGYKGGVGVFQPYLNDVWYSSDGVNWTQATASAGWNGRDGHTSIVFKNKMWVIGGGSDVWYSSDGVNWTQATASAGWVERYDHASVVFKNKMWVIGGADSGLNVVNDVWYSTDGVNWTQATAHAGWAERYGHTSVVFKNKMWVIGGTQYAGFCEPDFNDVWYSTDGVNWTQATASPGWEKRYYHTSVVFDNKMWVIGGYNSGYNDYLNDVWFSTDGANWIQTTASAGWSKRWGHTSIVFKNKMWVIGGYNYYTEYLNDVWYSPSDIWNP